jgi:glycosyltransferase involved in cell wall biosynthesis
MNQPTNNPTCQIPRTTDSLISIVVPSYNEGGNVKVLAVAVAEALNGYNYELIFVDDGSSDNTFDEIAALSQADARVVGLSLSRNFGHQYALAAGLKSACGQAVIMMDGDMQHPPTLLPSLIEKWRLGYNVVQAQRMDSQHVPWLKRSTSRAFYRVFSACCGIKIDPGMADFRLLDRCVLDELNALQEGQLFLRGLVAWMGYRTAVVPFEVAQRHSGKSKYTVGKMLRFAQAGIFAFSSVPLRMGITIGLVMAGLSFAEFAYVIIAYLAGWSKAAGWASTLAVISLLFGVLFLLVGIQGEYIARIYERVQHRPPFLVERKVGRQNNARK